MKIDCSTCRVRDLGCGDCVVSVMLRRPSDAHVSAGPEFQLDDEEQAAVRNLAAAGLVPPLRLVAPGPVLRLTGTGDTPGTDDRGGTGGTGGTGATVGTVGADDLERVRRRARGGISDRSRRRSALSQWDETDIA